MESDLQTETETQSSILNIVFIFWDKFYSALIPPQLVMTANWLYPSVPFSFSVVSQPPTLPSVNSSNIWNKGHRWTVSWTSKSFHYSILGMLWAAIYLNCVIVSTDFVICDVPLSLQALHSHMNQVIAFYFEFSQINWLSKQYSCTMQCRFSCWHVSHSLPV